MTFTSRLFLMVAAFVAFVCSFPAAQTLGQPERFTANAVLLSPQYGTGQQTVEITVDRWSLASDRERLVTALQQKGPDVPLPDGGRTIVIATDRPIGFWEATNRPRTFDYPFTVIQMKIGGEVRDPGRCPMRPRSSRRTT
jgi:hypothetical protein